MFEDTRLSAYFFREADDPALAEKVFRFRHDLFYEKERWPLAVKNGLEKDEFDTPHAVHCALLSGDDVACYFRASRCNSLFLSAAVFPQLAINRAYPTDADYWDISRFGIKNDYRYLSTLLYGLLFRFAVSQDASGLLCILTPARHRQLKRIGLTLKPYGPPQAINVDRDGKAELALACEVPMSEQNFSVVRPMINLTRHMEIRDEMFIFRSARAHA